MVLVSRKTFLIIFVIECVIVGVVQYVHVLSATAWSVAIGSSAVRWWRLCSRPWVTSWVQYRLWLPAYRHCQDHLNLLLNPTR